MRIFSTSVLFLSLISNAFSQYAEVRGRIYDTNRDPVEFAIVRLMLNEETHYLVETDYQGGFQIKTVRPGTYVLDVATISTGSYKETMRLTSGSLQIRDSIILNTGSVLMEEADIRRPVNTEETNDLGEEELKKLPSVNPTDAILLQPRTENRGGRPEVSKGKTGSTQYLFEGNTGLIGPLPWSNVGIESVQVIDLGVSARFGGFTGGAIAYRTSIISLKPIKSLQLQSSSPFNAFHHNLASFYTSKALKTKEIEGKKESRLVFGLSFSGSYRYQKDPNPAIDGYMTASEEARRNIALNPLSSSELVGGYVPTASFLTSNDLVKTAVTPNADRHDISGQLKASWNPSKHMHLDIINGYNYIYRRLPVANNLILNSDNNPLQQYHFANTQVNYTHRIKSPYTAAGKSIRDSNDLFSSIFYSIEVNHQYTESSVKSFTHGDNVFDYGYVGQFNTSRVPVYTYQNNMPVDYKNADGSEGRANDYWALTGYRDTLTNYAPSGQNPELANYSRFIYSTLGTDVSMQNFIQRGGLINGQNLPQLYSLYANQGTTYGSYNKNYQQRLGLTAYSEASFHPFRNHKLQHDVEFGMNFQQDRIGYYSLNASGLWQLMNLLANTHVGDLDLNNPIASVDENGRFTDSLSYNVLVNYETQKQFDRNLRDALIASGKVDANGDLIGESSWIDVNSLRPSDFSLSMFSADELLNNGNSYVSYSGYDHLGNKQRGKKGLAEFITDPLNRPNDGFNPVNVSAWIQDKFVFRNLVMRAGLRFERYDANQMVLKDPFVIYPAKQVGETSELQGVAVHHPSSVQNYYVVYVNDMNNPTSVVGYRDQDQWYDSKGNQVSDPSLLANASSSGRIQPLLIDPESQVLSVNSFTSYKPQNLVLPRISFSFPIKSSQLVYMSYDKLAQNPDPGLNYLPYTSYYFMQSNISSIIPNPELKARVKTEYNIGFKQQLGKYASLNLSASYATIRNDFNQYRLEGAYPYSYTTYSNIDFSAIKRYFAEYEYTSKHLTLNASYALQFADGTGSNVNSAASLIQSGQPNLRSLFPLSFDNRHTLKGFLIYSFGRDIAKIDTYKGPIIGGRQILKDAFISFTIQSLSGYPYSATLTPVSEAQASNGVVQRTQLKGNPFGNRLVWRHLSDVRFEKAFKTTEEQTISGYVVVSNVFNLRIVQSVYSYTGLAGDDGYLNSPQGQQQVRNQIDAETFTTLYRLRMNNQNNFGAPRNVQMGLKMNF